MRRESKLSVVSIHGDRALQEHLPHDDPDEAAVRGLFGIVWFAFVLGFGHEEEFEIIALCAGSNYCLELMSVYAITVIIGIVGMTLLLIAGYQSYEEKVKQYTPYLPVFPAIVLIIMEGRPYCRTHPTILPILPMLLLNYLPNLRLYFSRIPASTMRP